MKQQDPLEFEITDQERRHLRELMRGAGYAVIKKIQSAYLETITESAAAMSLADPLANQEAIARRWAYVAITKQIIESLESGIAFELNLLNAKDAPPTPPAELAMRRRHAVLGYLDPYPTSGGEKTGEHEVGVPQ